jgi:thioredoxin 1
MNGSEMARMFATGFVAVAALGSMAGCQDSSDGAMHGYQSTNVVTLNETNLQTEILASPTLAMVDFWAVWCGPCKVLAPTVGAIADDYAGRLKVGAVDVDVVPGLAQRYEIEGMPTLLFFKDGHVVDRILGLVGKRELQQKIDSLLARAPAPASVPQSELPAK